MKINIESLSKKELIEKFLDQEKKLGELQDQLISSNESRDFYLNLLDNVNDLVFIHPISNEGIPGNFRLVNKSVVNNLGYSKKELNELSPRNITEEEFEDLEKKRQTLLAKKQLLFNTILIGKQKQKIEAELNTKIINHNGEILAITIARDFTRLKNAESALKKSEQSKKAILNASKDNMMLIDTNGNIIETNGAVLKLLNVRKVDAIGRNLSWFFGEKHQNKRMDYIKEVINTKKPVYHLDVAYNRNWDTSFYPVFDQNNNVISIAVYQRDITVKTRTETKLRESEERLNLVLEAAQLGWWDFDFITNTVSRNNTWYEMLGYKEEPKNTDIKFYTSIIHPEDINSIQTSIVNHESGKSESYSFEHRLKNVKGEYRWIYNWGEIIERDPTGKPLRAVGVHMDITDKKQAEINEQMLLNSYSGIFDSSIDAIFLLDNKGEFIAVNNTAIKMYDYSKEEFIGKSPSFLSAPGKNDLNAISDYITRAYHGEQVEFDFWGLKKNGEEFPKIVRLSKVNYMGQDSVIAFGLDITARHKAENELKKSEQRYRTIFNQVPISIAQLDDVGNIIDINNFHLNHIAKRKLKHEDFIGKNILERESILKAGIAGEYKKLLMGKSIELSEVYFPITTGGSPAYLSIQGVPLFSEGKQSGAIITTENVTQNVLNRKKLKEVEVKLGLALEGASIGFWEQNFKTQKVWRSKKWFEMLGYKKSDFGDDQELWVKLIHPDDIEATLKAVDSHRRNEIDEVKVEHRLKNSNGGYQWIINWGKIIERDNNGTPIRAAGIHLDITERKEKENLLKESEKKYSTLIEQANEGILIIQDLEIKYANKYIIELLGYQNEEVINSSVERYVSKEVFEQLSSNFYKRINGEDVPSIYESKVKRKDGSILPVEINSIQITFKGKPAVQVILRDITQRLKSEQEKYERQKELDLIYNSTSDYMTLIKVEKDDFKLISFNNAYWEFARKINPNLEKELLYNASLTNISKIFGFPAEANDYLLSCYKKVISAKSILELIETIPLNGSTITLESKYTPVLNERGDCTHILYVSKDITNNKLAEERFRYLAAMLESSPLAYVVTDLNGSITDISPALENLVGYSKDELLGKSPGIFNAELNADEIQEDIFKTLEQKKTWSGELLNKKKNGETFYIYSSIFPLLNKDGEVNSYIGFLQDVTQRIKAEKKLRESDEYIRSIFLSAPIGIGVVVNRIIIKVNSRLSEMTGYKEEELLNQNSQILYPNTEEYEKVGREKYNQIKKYGIGTVETIWELKDGSLANVLLSSTPMDQNDLSKGVTFTALNITDAKKSEEKLKMSEAQFRSLFENMHEGIFYQSADGILTDVNESALEIFGIARKEFLGTTPVNLKWNVIDNNEKELPLEKLPSMIALTTGKEVLGTEVGLKKTKSNEVTWLAVNAIPQFRYGDEKPFQVFVSMHDITEQRKATSELIESQYRYKNLFNNQPTIIWEEDFSEVKKRLDRLVEKGTKDFRTYFDENPKEIEKLANVVRVVEINNTSLEILEADSKEEIVMNLPYYFDSPEAWDVFKEEMIELAGGASLFESEIPIRTVKGNRKHLAFRLVVLPEHKNDFKRILVSFIDITERKRAEQEIIQSNKKYQALFNNSPVPLWEEDFTELFNYFEQLKKRGIKNFENFFNENPNEVIICSKKITIKEVNEACIASLNAKNMMDVLGNVDRVFTERAHDVFKKELIALGNGEMEFESEAEMRTAPGEIKHVFLKLNIEKENSKSFRGIVATMDITERKHAEKLLKETENNLRAILNASSDVIALIDRSGKFIEVNRVLHKLSNLTKDELINSQVYDYLTTDSAKRSQEHIKNVFETKSSVMYDDFVFDRTWENNLYPIFGLDGEVDRLAVFSRDITEKSLFEKRLKETNDKLRKLSIYLNDVREEERKKIAREVHDNLGQKLTALNLDISWIRQSIPKELNELRELFDPILELINQSIITVQKISTELRPGILDDLGLVNAIQWQCNEISRKSELEFTLNLDKKELDLAENKKTALFRVFQEAMTNILRHSKAKKISVKLESKREKLIFEISDDGVGIKGSEINSISSFGILGMKERISAINGNIEIKNNSTKGTKIRIVVPI